MNDTLLHELKINKIDVYGLNEGDQREIEQVGFFAWMKNKRYENHKGTGISSFLPVVENKGLTDNHVTKYVVDNKEDIKNRQIRRHRLGRPRKYANAAERQKSYRERRSNGRRTKKAIEGTDSTSNVVEHTLDPTGEVVPRKEQ